MDSDRKYKVRAVDRALSILECLTVQQPELTINGIAEQLGLHRSVVYRLLITLRERGYVEYDPAHEIYRLGVAPLRLAGVILQSFDLRAKARPHLEALMQVTGETVHLAVLDRTEALVIEKIESFHSVRMASTVGFRSPLHCTGVGKALLAFISSDDAERILPNLDLCAYTPNTITDRDALRRHLDLIREQGYAIDNEEIEVGLRCVAAPIYDYSGKVVASLSISGPSSRMSDAELPTLIDAVLVTAGRITRELGGRQPVDNGPLTDPDATSGPTQKFLG